MKVIDFNLDEKFTNVIFLTYRSFVTAEEFLDNLLLCFFSKLSDEATEEEVEIYKKTKVPTQLKYVVLIRVLKLFHQWIESHWHDFGLSSELRMKLRIFLEMLVNTPNGEFTEVARGLMFVSEIQVYF
jgi:hypothetical protein